MERHEMHYLGLATDFDGTLAHGGLVEPEVVDALLRLRASGRRVILVTGRELPELLELFPDVRVFDRMVVENGALLYDPATKKSRVLAPPPPGPLIEELQRRQIPCSIGRSIVATTEPYEHRLLSTIRDLGLEWHVIFNKGAVMALPSGVNKASGLAAALEELQLSADRVAAIGDAENDHALLHYCCCGVAVANALPALKEGADLVTVGAAGRGVIELIERMLADDLADVPLRTSAHQPRPHAVPQTDT
jgi:hydroxymethylpyrimidine pyrophosphatase-like HAD family hydrolase